MTEQVKLKGVKETLLFTLYFRALDARKPQPILGDPWATKVLDRIEFDDRKTKLSGGDIYTGVLRAKRMDDWTLDFLARHPDAVVLHLGCGLDSRAFRLDVPSGVDWYDLDYPDVIALRQKLYPSRERYHTIGSSVTDLTWLDSVPTDRPTLVVAEGLLMYLSEADVMRVLGAVSTRFPLGGELILDTTPPWIAAFSRLFGYHLWGLSDPRSLSRRFPRLTLAEDRPVPADYARIPAAGPRRTYALATKWAPFRNYIRPLRYTITPS